MELSLLELFYTAPGGYQEAAITSLTDSALLERVNQAGATSGVTGAPFLPNTYLGSVTRQQLHITASFKSLHSSHSDCNLSRQGLLWPDHGCGGHVGEPYWS